MGKREGNGFGKALTGALSVLLAITLVWTSPWGGGFAQAVQHGRIEGDATPMAAGTVPEGSAAGDPADSAASAVPPRDGGSSDSVSSEDLPALAYASSGEAERAADERAIEPAELGYVPGEIVVVYEEDATPADQEDVAAVVGADEEPESASVGTGEVAVVPIADELTVDTAVEAVADDEAVRYAFPNYVATTCDDAVAQPQGATSLWLADDNYAASQWYVSAVKAPAAWEALATSGYDIKPVRVGVLDTGASVSHPDLTGILDRERSGELVWTGETSDSITVAKLRGDGYLNGSVAIPQASTHGTHVTGIIGARAANGGVLGVASGAGTELANKLVEEVVFDIFSTTVKVNGQVSPSATVADIYFGLRKAADAGCAVINMSLGFYAGTDKNLQASFEELLASYAERGVLVVCAAGNDNTSSPCLPASLPSALGVISLSREDAILASSTTLSRSTWKTNGYMRSWFSNYGDWCDIAAPGERILSTAVIAGKDDFGYLDGTSMASPVVAATAALVRAANPDLSVSEVRAILCETATDVNTRGKDAQSGYGLVNAETAVRRALAERDETASGGIAPAKSSAEGGSTVPDAASEPTPAPKPNPTPKPAPAPTPAPSQPKPNPSDTPNASKVKRNVWGKVGSKRCYYGADGKLARGLRKIGGSWYYFDKAGRMKTGWVTWSGGKKRSYFDPKTGKAKTGFAKIKGKTFYFDKKTAKTVSGRKKIRGSWYYFDKTGRMKTGWVKWSGGTRSYFSKKTGKAYTGYKKIGGKVYYFSRSTAKTRK